MALTNEVIPDTSDRAKAAVRRIGNDEIVRRLGLSKCHSDLILTLRGQFTHLSEFPLLLA